MHPSEPLIEQPASRLAAVAIDILLTVACYLMAYRLRFEPTDFGLFLPTAVRALPLVALSQIAALLASRAYTYRQGKRWFPRLLVGIFAGTAIGALLTGAVLGFQGVSRISFAVDALLLALAAFGWRAVAGIARLVHQVKEERASSRSLEDRTAAPSVSAGLLGLVRYRELLKNLVLRDLKLKYRGSVFGFFWSLANPVLMIVTYTVVFTQVLRIRTPDFVFTLLLGLLNWTFFSNSTMMSTGAVIDASALIKSVAFPRVILPVATVMFNLAQFLLTIAVFLPVAVLVFGAGVSSAILLVPLVLALEVLFTTGVALALAAITSYFRDVKHILEIGLGILFWTTPILYQYETLPEFVRLPVLLSPMSSFVIAWQQIFHGGRVPDLAVWLTATSYSVGMFVLGASIFVSTEDRLAELV